MTESAETKIAVLSEHIDHIDTRLDKIEKELENYSQIMLSLQSINDSLKQVTNNIVAMDTRLQTLEQAPVRKWNTLIKTAFTALISACVGGAITWLVQVMQQVK